MERIRRLFTMACLVCISACVSTNVADTGQERTYSFDIGTVAQAAAEAFAKAGLVTEGADWYDANTYVITGHRESRLIRAGGEGVNLATVTVYIDQVDEMTTTVRVETSERDLPATASSADRRGNEARAFFSRLDAELGL